MSRRRKALHRSILPDPRFHSTLVTELVGVVLKQGKKTIAEQIVYTALEQLDKRSKARKLRSRSLKSASRTSSRVSK